MLQGIFRQYTHSMINITKSVFIQNWVLHIPKKCQEIFISIMQILMKFHKWKHC